MFGDYLIESGEETFIPWQHATATTSAMATTVSGAHTYINYEGKGIFSQKRQTQLTQQIESTVESRRNMMNKLYHCWTVSLSNGERKQASEKKCEEKDYQWKHIRFSSTPG